MFTGIIEGLGTITGVRTAGRGQRLTVQADFPLAESKIGDSIAVSGACLTAVVVDGNVFEVDVSPETIANTTFSRVKTGDRVNLERALRLSDRIDGHLVSGHIDGTGFLMKKQAEGNAIVVRIRTARELMRHVIRKGSVAIDGISLTVNRHDRETFDVSIIPHTAKLTSIGFKNEGDPVNIETDMIGKYVERFVSEMKQSDRNDAGEKGSIDMQFLAKSGFL